MRGYILGKPGHSMASARILARTFRSMGHRVWATSNLHKSPVIINWGNSSCTDNNAINFGIVTDKMEQLVKLKPHIRTLNLLENIPNDFDQFPVFCRKRYHQQGNDIVIAMSMDELVACDYYTIFEPFQRELRIQVFEDQFRGFIKEREEEDAEYPIKNVDNNYNFRWIGLSQELKDFCVKTLEVLGVKFGCIDIGVLPQKEYCVIEVNSAPSIINNENTLVWYIERFLGSL